MVKITERLVPLLLLLSSALVVPAEAKPSNVRHTRHAVPNEYIVVLQEGSGATISTQAQALARQYKGHLRNVWQYAIRGFLVQMPPERAEAMSRDPRVLYLEESAVLSLSSVQETRCDPALGPCSDPGNANDNRLWHLDRIDEAQMDHRHVYCSTGSGVTVYVVDTGVMRGHSEFITANVKAGYNAAGDSGENWTASQAYTVGDWVRVKATGDTWACTTAGTSGGTQPTWASSPQSDGSVVWQNIGKHYPADDPCQGFPQPGTADDAQRYSDGVLGSGHGTSIASLVAGKSTGTAKNALIVPVKVARCDMYAARRWQSSHAYQGGDMIVATGSQHTWKCITAGTSSTSEPAWPTTITTQSDGSVTWKNVGPSSNVPVQTTPKVIEGVEWILSPDNPNPKSGSIATFSAYVIKGDPYQTGTGSFDSAVLNLIGAGITVIASANNQDDDACNTSPAHLSRGNPDPDVLTQNKKVITVGGSMLVNDPDAAYMSGNGGPSVLLSQPTYQPAQPTRDARWICGAGDSDGCNPPLIPPLTFNDGAWRENTYRRWTAGSNWGQCVSLFAPAKNITSARLSGDHDYRNRLGSYSDTPLTALASGTSFATPIVAGVAARFLETHSTATVDEVYTALMNSARPGAMLDDSTYPLKGSPNVFVRATHAWIYGGPNGVTVRSNTPTTLSVSASGSGTLVYQWYQGTAGDTTHPLGTASTQSVTPSQSAPYWVRVACTCDSQTSSVSSPTVTVTVLDPPTALVATTSSNNTQVGISWTASPNATTYQLQRSTLWNSGFVNVGSPVSGTSATDAPASTSSPKTYVYQVVSLDGAGHQSAPSNIDYATVATSLFTDDPIIFGQTAIKRQHILELRSSVDAVRVAAGIGAASWSSLPSTITAASFNEVRTRLNDARQAMVLSNFPYTEAVAANGIIKKLHLDEMRTGVK